MTENPIGGGAISRRRLLTRAGSAVAVVGIISDVAPAGARAGRASAVAFDAFTIFDPRAPAAAVEECYPGRGKEIFAIWRSRQFEYCWLRTLNRDYADFRHVTEEALIFACKSAKVELDASARARLMDAAFAFKPWPDSVAALRSMRNAGIRLAYLSNLTPEILAGLSEAAGIADLFEHRLSTDLVKAFKPDPRAYQMAETAFDLSRDRIVFAAFGGWDAAGAKAFGLTTFWVNRLDAPLEELGVRPDAIGTDLVELVKFVG
ncbi:haloacid dehalogenase type II [Rhodoblastus sp. 17X3]|uniref:haloacid dehalogenase type II n=1 Tax=Rhodoblastus sp. 17X3 TaxID=3047026 RepID=UPI0024B6EF88|nr:haloacid dehalogenase type II [Rhodoblastus sp. 17X3]MDI9848896.1 haloacid dehalogenase type II [Rhodoblastus sp. 17X3]